MTHKICDNIYSVGVDDRTSGNFEALWRIPDGISYNSYLLEDEKIVLFDTVKESKFAEFLTNIRQVIGEKAIDYLVIHHLEPDHSGAIGFLKELYPEMKIVGNSKTAEFLSYIFPELDDVQRVEDIGTLECGQNKLEFHKTPMIHWPETMMSFISDRGVLFSGDAFGAFGASNGLPFDGQRCLEDYEDDLLRYYSNIVGKYSSMVSKALKTLGELDIKLICPAHGVVWSDNPSWIIEKYRLWSSHIAQEGVVIVYGSMYGSAEKAAEFMAASLREQGIEQIKMYNACEGNNTYIIRDIWKYNGLLLTCSTYDTRVFPLMDNLLSLLKGKKPKNKTAGVIGTYGWSGGAAEGLKKAVEDCKFQLAEPVIEPRFRLSGQDYANMRKLAKTVAEQITQKKGD